MLSLVDVHAGYGSIPVLHGVNIDVRDRELVTVIGPNGAGKTTLMRSIVGQIDVKQGTATFDGSPLTGPPELRARSGICLVPEGRGIFPRLTVEENLRLGAFVRSDNAAIAADFDEVFARFPILQQRRTSLAGSLSGGQQQMLAIARALLARPKLMLLDEPTLGLAPLIVDEVLGIVAELPERGMAVLLVEQNINKALHIADRAYVLERGSVTVAGTPAEVRAAGTRRATTTQATTTRTEP